jgi:ATP-dependent DNA ligase
VPLSDAKKTGPPLKLERQQEFVIGGYRPDGANGLDAVLVGYYESRELRFAGKVRAGLIPHVRREVLAKLKPLKVSDCPFANLPDASAGAGAGVSPPSRCESRISGLAPG